MVISRPEADRAQISTFRALEIFDAALRREAAGEKVFHLQVGQPSKGAPKAALEAMRTALDTPLGYTGALGRPSLRARIAEWHMSRGARAVAPERVAATAGSSAAFQLAFLATLDVGKRLAVIEPGYPSYAAIAEALGIEVVRIAAEPSNGWKPTPDQLRAAAPLDAVLIASPANPTGATLTKAELSALMATTRELGAWYISDEIYHGLEHGDRAASALEVADDAIVISSFSKYFRMTGWRIGWMVVPDPLLGALERLAQNFFISAPTPGQIAAEAAFDGLAELEADRAVYTRNRDVLLDAARGFGLTEIAPPDGGFYLYANARPLFREGEDSLSFCQALLEDTNVAIASGYDFDRARGGDTVRMSFCVAPETLDEGVARIAAWAKARAAGDTQLAKNLGSGTAPGRRATARPSM